MKNSISKPVLGILAAGLVIIAAVLWFNFHPPAKSPPQPVGQPQAEAPAPAVPATNPPPVPVADQENGELPPVIPIPLTNIVISAENGSWLKDKDYLRVPHQPQVFGSVTFLMDGMLQLQGQMSKDWKKRNYRTGIVLPLALTNLTENGIEIIQRGSNVASLHLLGATRYGSGEVKAFVKIIWRYTDGTAAQTPVDYLTHFRDWVRSPYEQPDHLPYAYSKVVWTTPQPSAPGHALRLYRTTFANPAPKKIIQQLEFVSAMEDPTLFIVGVTLDPLKPGQRPDLSPDLEPYDSMPAKHIQIVVQTPDGQPLPQAKLQIQFQQRTDKKAYAATSYNTTDAAGSSLVSYPPADLERLSISASREDYGSRKMLWDVKDGDTIPDSYTFKLTSALAIGGIVMDLTNGPIAGAKVSLYRFWSGNDDSPDRAGDHPDFSNLAATTDDQGRWQAKGLPVELLPHIGFSVKHPDFISESVMGINGSAEKQLLDGTYKITLQHGLDVYGRVLDDSDVPISGATVSVGERYSQDHQQAKTDGDGKFSFHDVSSGPVVFGASASGRAPDNRSINVAPDMPEIVFRLGPGKDIHAIVQDDNGAPISGVQVSLDGRFAADNAYTFSATTDNTGRFEWDAAPSNDVVQFSFYKDGYESKNSVTLHPDQDNTVIMHAPRQLQGQVVDADSGQPVTKFTIRTGHRSNPASDDIYGVIRDHDFNSQDGTFTLSLDQEDDDALRVTSDDYATQTQSFPDPQNGVIQMTIRLKSSPGVKGVVLAPDGTPAPGVSVAITVPGSGNDLQLQGTHLSSWNIGYKVVTTDASGQFTLSSPPSTGGTVVAVGEQGFFSAPLDQVRANPTLTLQAFGRIEGTLNIGGQPGVGKELTFNLDNLGLQTDFNTFKATTDDQGKFTMEQLPPGDGAISRVIPMSASSWTFSDRTAVTVNAGQTTQVTLGDNGAVINGTVRLESPSTNGETFLYNGNISGQMPNRPTFNTPAEAQAYYQSPEWQALAQQVKHYAFVVNPNGSFTVDDVVPGTYTINISVLKNSSHPWSHPPVASGHATFTVPDSFSPSSPMDIGEIVLTPVPSQ